MKMRPASATIWRAAAGLLVVCCPELTEEKLEKALRTYDPSGEKAPNLPLKPWTLRDAAEFLGVCIPSVRKAIRLGKIRAAQLPGSRMVRIDPESVYELVNTKRETAVEMEDAN